MMDNNIIFAFVTVIMLLAGALVYLVYRIRAVSCKVNELYSIGMNAVRAVDERLAKNVEGLCEQLYDLGLQIDDIKSQIEVISRLEAAADEHEKELERTKNALEHTENAQNSIKNELDELNGVFNDLVQGYLAAETEAANAEARAEEAFNKGMNSIINYGDGIARLNKEGLNGRQ